MDHEVFAYEQRQSRARFIARHGVWIGTAIGLLLAIALQLAINYFNGGL